MVFSSLPIYLDPPNWNQHQAPNQAGSGGGGGGGEAQQLPPGLAASHPEAGMTVAVRPGSMAERARLAKIPQPEPALKCPRCDSTNTKFCYFNNYSLSQPRHFCKTCRRYWTRGGALRNVPVGGGCRRNKRNKAGGSSSKSSATATATATATTTTTSTSSTATSGGAIPSNIMPPPQLSFMSSLHPLADYSTNNIGLNYSGIQPIDTVDYQLGSSSSFGLDQWRIQQIQQFPFLGGLDHHPQQPSVSAPGMGLFPFDAEVGADEYSPQVLPKVSGSGLINQLASVKMEDSPQGFSLPRQYLGITGNDQYWGNANTGSNSSSNAGWALDFSGFNSSSSGNLL